MMVLEETVPRLLLLLFCVVRELVEQTILPVLFTLLQGTKQTGTPKVFKVYP